MEEKRNNHPEGCKCPVCNGGKCEVCGPQGCPTCPYCPLHGGYCCHWHWVKWVLALIVLGVVFCAGFKLGAFFSSWGGGYRSEMPVRYMMSGWNRGGSYDYQQAPMMRYYYNSSAKTSTSTGGQ